MQPVFMFFSASYMYCKKPYSLLETSEPSINIKKNSSKMLFYLTRKSQKNAFSSKEVSK